MSVKVVEPVFTKVTEVVKYTSSFSKRVTFETSRLWKAPDHMVDCVSFVDVISTLSG